MKAIFFAALAALVWVGASTQALPLDSSKTITTFAFGGCNFQRRSQAYWPNIQAEKPQLWVWNGDIIYADILGPILRRNEYRHLKSRPTYKAFAASTMVIGTWDDHDYGSNNIGKEWDEKEESRDMLLEFLDEPADSRRWTQKGVYASYVFGAKGKRAKFVLLDQRWFREEPGEDSEILGEAQWKWLESEVMRGDYEALFIVSSSQIIPMDHDADSWGQYPEERARLFKLLATVEQPTTILSGDRHLSEISKAEVGRGKLVHEFTSSGLTHSAFGPSKNRYRVGPQYVDRNFGVVKIDWDAQKPKIAMEIHAISGKTVFRHRAE